MTTGTLPVDAETYFQIIGKITTETPRSVAELRPDAPHALVEIIERAMAKQTGSRFPSARALERDLKHLDADARG
jgi:hypothetical protein